ncbi:MAG: zinc-binding dehydrogenase [Gammaproteobacteria bacterium]
MENFTAYRVHNDDQRIQARLESVTLNDLAPGDVVIQAAYSDVNYKDALAVTGKGKIMRRFPLVAGIDVAGTVAESGDPRFQAGQEVLVVGCGLGEAHDGGYSVFVRVPGDWIVPLPEGLSLYESGGVGSVAVDLLAGRGYEVHAISGKADAADYLRRLGASEVIDRKSLELGTRPLEKACWGGAIDNLGGDLLAWLTRTVKPWGNIASIGLASSPALATTVIPFILRGVSLLGIYSVEVPPALRQRVWQRLAGDLRPRHLESIVSRVVSLAEVEGVFEPLMQGTMTGRTVVRIGG